MKLFFVLVTVAAFVSAKPVEKTKRQFNYFSQNPFFNQPTSKQINFDQTIFDQGVVVQPEITNVGTSGLNSNSNLVSSTTTTTTASPLENFSGNAPNLISNGNSESLVGAVPGFTGSNQIFGSGLSTASPLNVIGSEQVFGGNLASGVAFSDGNLATASPANVISSGQVFGGNLATASPANLIGSKQLFGGNLATRVAFSDGNLAPTSPLNVIGSEQLFGGNLATGVSSFGTNQNFDSQVLNGNLVSTVSPLGSEVSTGNFASTVSPLIGSEIQTGSLGSTVAPSLGNFETIQSRIGLDDIYNFYSNQNENQQTTYTGKSEVTKNVYFYEAPEDYEPIRARKIIQVPQKINYKLLFIKAPSVPEPKPIEIPANLYNQEKTRVYVLVKKPQHEQEVKIVSAPTEKPEKPEVFYIKYNTREEAEKAIKDAEAGIASGSQKEFLSIENSKQLLSSIGNQKISTSGVNQFFKNGAKFESSTVLPFISSTIQPSSLNFIQSSTFQPEFLYSQPQPQPIFTDYSSLLRSSFNLNPKINTFSSYPTFVDYNQIGFRSGKNINGKSIFENEKINADVPSEVKIGVNHEAGISSTSSTSTPIFTNSVSDFSSTEAAPVENDSTTISEV